MNKSNVRLRTNVLCTELWSEEGKCLERLKTDDERKRLDYWELRELAEVFPNKYPMTWIRDNLTPLQRAQRDAFIRLEMRELWPDFSHFRPIEPQTSSKLPPESIPETPTVKPPPTVPPGPIAELVDDEVERIIKPPPLILPPSPTVAGVEDPQKLVVDLPFDKSVIVSAPPGTGKTHVLIERICRIIESGDIENPSDEVVVLSFTNAAVAEITRRVLEKTGRGQDDLRYVTIRTFDSFATYFLRKDYSPENLGKHGYDERIKLFSSMLRMEQSSDMALAVNRIRCLLVDEIQDISGPRAEMVIEMAKRIIDNAGGVTLLGDPAQSIYDWNVKDGDLTSSDFLKRMRDILGVSTRDVYLSKNFRFKNNEIKTLADRARQAMGEDGSEPDASYLQGLLNELPEIRLEELYKLLNQGKTAVLTRNRLEAWQVVKWCRGNGVKCELSRGATGSYWPGWIGRLVFEFKQEKMSRRLAQRRWGRLGIEEREIITFEDAWEFLMEQGAADQATLDLLALSEKMMRRAPLFMETDDEHKGVLTVSTIHRSKGLEFDNVILLMPGSTFAGNYGETKFEETRVLYVAATRARKALKVLVRERSVFYRFQTALSHFHIYRDNKNSLLLEGVSDLDMESLLSPPGVAHEALPDMLRLVQDKLWEKFSNRGGNLAAEKRDDDFVLLLPGVQHNDRVATVCAMSGYVKGDLINLGRRFRGSADRVLGFSDVPVVDLATVAFSQYHQTAARLLGPACLAVAPVVQGEAGIEMLEVER